MNCLYMFFDFRYMELFMSSLIQDVESQLFITHQEICGMRENKNLRWEVIFVQRRLRTLDGFQRHCNL